MSLHTGPKGHLVRIWQDRTTLPAGVWLDRVRRRRRAGVPEAVFIATIASTASVLGLVGSTVLRLRDLPGAAD